MDKRIEIFRDGIWRELVLEDRDSIQYNKVINKISKYTTREINHTNTFSIPLVSQNTLALGLNRYNAIELARTLNVRYRANYFIGDKLFKKGECIINNTDNGVINLNFIDGSLNLVDNWNNITYRDLLRDDSIQKPDDYQTVIDTMLTYDMDPNAKLTPLPLVGQRGNKLAIFPSGLNCIGEKFQIDSSGFRFNGQFSPYQSRPLFSVKAMMDLATESFGYLPVYDNSINWGIVGKTYMCAEGLRNKSETKLTSRVLSTRSMFIQGSGQSRINYFEFAPDQEFFIPSEKYPAWNVYPWANERTGYIPNINDSLAGEIVINVSLSQLAESVSPFYSVGIWSEKDDDSTVARVDYMFASGLAGSWNATAGTGTLIIDKSKIRGQAGYSKVTGLTISARSGNPYSFGLYLSNVCYINEEYSEVGDQITFDEYLQYDARYPDLTHAAPDKTIKTLLKGIFEKEGILVNIDDNKKIVTFHSYSKYSQDKKQGKYRDWSQYYQKHTIPQFNTTYGSQYGRTNLMGLNDPYPGNTATIDLKSQQENSKYVESVDKLLRGFKDIKSVSLIEQDNVDPYFEYEVDGLSLVEDIGTQIEGLEQRFIGTPDLSIDLDYDLPAMANVNGSTVPSGVVSWFNLVDKAARVNAKFLLPIEEIQDLNLSEPIYVADLGGFFIVEEIEEYQDPQTIVIAKLIKLIDE